MKKLAVFLLLTLLFASCGQSPKKQTSGDLISYRLIPQPTDDPIKDVITSIDFLKLEITPDALFSTINKVIVRDDKVFVFELQGNNRINVFDRNSGDFLYNVGRIGKGPGEYIMLRNFTATGDTLLLLNRQKKQMLYYTLGGAYLGTREMPFRAEDIRMLESGNLLFALQRGDFKGRKLLVTDRDFNLQEELLSIGPCDADDYLSMSLFQGYAGETLYNRPINDSLYIIDGAGNTDQIIHLDFGTYTLPFDMRKDYERVYREAGDSYAYLLAAPVLTRDYLVGNFIKDKKRYSFVLNRQNGKIYVNRMGDKNDFSVMHINTPQGVYGQNTVVAYLNSDMLHMDRYGDYGLPNEYYDHLSNGGSVLVFIGLKDME